MAGQRVQLEIQRRDGHGSRAARRLRAQGLIPGVLYGGRKPARSFSVSERELRRVLTGDHGTHAILDVVVEGESKPHHAVVKHYELHPVRGNLIHIDLQEVRLDRAIQVQVAVEFVGTPEGVVEGGVLSQVVREVTVEALPMDVPDRLPLDVSRLAIGDSLRVADLLVPEGMRVLDDEETVLATVTPPTRVEEPVVEEEVEEEEVEEAAPEAEARAEEQPEGAAEGPAEPEREASSE